MSTGQGKLQVARSTAPLGLTGPTKAIMRPNALKQFETYDRSHFQAQHIRQQPSTSYKHPNEIINQPRISITHIVQNTQLNPETGIQITNPIKKTRAEFSTLRVNT